MNFHVCTLFPDMIDHVARTSILGRAISCGLIGLDLVNIRDYSTRKTMRVDGYPYGGGAGMVMEPEPVYQAVLEAKRRAGQEARVIYLTPAAEVLTQSKAEELAKEEDLVLLCGHYEGIDERVLEEVVTDNLSIGDYVLTGGELGACVIMDAVSRFVPGVLHNDESSQVESIQDNLLEYPQYTRPEVWHDKAVPELLLSGDHAKIEAWRHEQSVKRTRERRPDLFAKSFRVKVVHFGSEENALAAEELAGQISNYTEVLDYNRRKQQKQKTRFGAKDLVVIVTDKPEESAAVLNKMTADGAQAIVIENGVAPEGETEAFLKEQGFQPKGCFNRSTDLESAIKEIRKITTV